MMYCQPLQNPCFSFGSSMQILRPSLFYYFSEAEEYTPLYTVLSISFLFGICKYTTFILTSSNPFYCVSRVNLVFIYINQIYIYFYFIVFLLRKLLWRPYNYRLFVVFNCLLERELGLMGP